MITFFGDLHTSNQTGIKMEGNVKTVKVYYLYHNDGFSRISPILIVDGGRIWQAGVKNRLSRRPMYYIFDENLYVKLWMDKKENLLYYFGNHKGLIFDEDPDVLIADPKLQWGADSLWRIGGKKIRFSLPIFNIVWKVGEELWRPTAYVLAKMYGVDSQEEQTEQNAGQE